MFDWKKGDRVQIACSGHFYNGRTGTVTEPRFDNDIRGNVSIELDGSHKLSIIPELLTRLPVA